MQRELNGFLKALGKEIFKARKRLGISQAELAEKADLSLTYISKIERGHKNISAYTLSKISQALKLSSIKIIFNVCRDKITIVKEEVDNALNELPVQKHGEVLQLLRILSRIITK